MNDFDILNVWFENKIVGQLWRDSASNMGFRYDEKWLNTGFAISQQLPLSIKEYSPESKKAQTFFSNLLPEAGSRIHIVKDLKITNTDFELLKAIGGECAGALSILPIDFKPTEKSEYKKLSNKELTKIILQKGSITSFVSENNRPRLSLAGAQDKCPVRYDGYHYFLPKDASPSTHIIKFEMSDYRHIPAYEYFLMLFSNTIQLPTSECQLKKQANHYFLLVKRYDRVSSDHKIKRLHQEDFCQALGVSYENKYQQDGGPSFYDCFKLVQEVSTNPIIDSENLLKWQIFNCLAGNSEGHAKNLALLYTNQQEVRLAPFYDLVCTRAIERIDSKLALSVGGEFNPDKLTLTQWENLAKQCSIRPKYLFNLLHNIAETLLQQFESTKTQFETEQGEYPALQRIKLIVDKQCKKILKQLA